MRLLLFFFSLSLTLNACDNDVVKPEKETSMEQKDIIALVEKNDLRAVESALKNGGDVNTQDSKKRTLLLIATENQQTEMAKLLIVHGADVNKQDNKQDSPFLYAGASGQAELVKLYLANGTRFDIFNRYNGTALIPACERGHVETVKVLVQAKDFPINHVNRLGWTALMEAVILGNGTKKYQEIVQILRDGGAKLDIPDHEGVTALQHARRLGYTEIVNILES